ncbi:MAG TPA: hypothetical protein PLC07_02535 [Bacillota bacterium]|nr:hypothetical protein [Bacillota bacterium]HPT88149.1 hypothetical protein [Bacillota bacterium]
MSDKALATTRVPNNEVLQKSKPRYTEEENQILFESWWNPQQRRELVTRLGRKMSALRSQFCRLLKEKGMSNQEYYNMMQAKYMNQAGIAPRKRSREIKDIDRTILEVFAKHQALGNSRAAACEELQEILGDTFTTAALKLRFYRLLKRLNYQDADLVRLGKQVLGQQGETGESEAPSVVDNPVEKPLSNITPLPVRPVGDDHMFFYQLSSLPETIKSIEERLEKVEAQQRHQLDLRGFVEHLLAVERDLKREDKLMEEIQKLMDENERLQQKLMSEQEKIKKREAELNDVYKMLDTMLSDFMRLESVSKLASLGDFMHRLEITVDQFGNVLKSRRISPE